MSLALGLDIDVMLKGISSEKLSEYMAYDRVAMIDNEKIIYMLAQLTALTANQNGGKFKVSDFIPEHKKTEPLMDRIKAALSDSRRN